MLHFNELITPRGMHTVTHTYHRHHYENKSLLLLTLLHTETFYILDIMLIMTLTNTKLKHTINCDMRGLLGLDD